MARLSGLKINRLSFILLHPGYLHFDSAIDKISAIQMFDVRRSLFEERIFLRLLCKGKILLWLTSIAFFPAFFNLVLYQKYKSFGLEKRRRNNRFSRLAECFSDWKKTSHGIQKIKNASRVCLTSLWNVSAYSQKWKSRIFLIEKLRTISN